MQPVTSLCQHVSSQAGLTFIIFQNIVEQECIPVGCIPATHCPGRWGVGLEIKKKKSKKKIKKKVKNIFFKKINKKKKKKHFGSGALSPPRLTPSGRPPCAQTDACKLITLAQLRNNRIRLTYNYMSLTHRNQVDISNRINKSKHTPCGIIPEPVWTVIKAPNWLVRELPDRKLNC